MAPKSKGAAPDATSAQPKGAITNAERGTIKEQAAQIKRLKTTIGKLRQKENDKCATIQWLENSRKRFVGNFGAKLTNFDPDSRLRDRVSPRGFNGKEKVPCAAQCIQPNCRGPADSVQ
eukprot:5852732-Pyramimonas_sp.AAC.1